MEKETKAELDLDLCQAYGICAQIASEVFDLDDDGYVALVSDGPIPDELLKVAREAAEACPVRAIRLT